MSSAIESLTTSSHFVTVSLVSQIISTFYDISSSKAAKNERTAKGYGKEGMLIMALSTAFLLDKALITQTRKDAFSQLLL